MDLGCQSPNEVKEVFYFMAEEIFKPIPNYEGLYEVSNIGNVKSLKYKKNLKPYFSKKGYLRFILSKNKNIKGFHAHQLVAMAFLGHTPCGMKLVVDHINNIKTDNRVENLQILTNRDNVYKTQGNYTSKYQGVSWHKPCNKWISYIYVNKKKKYLGLFIDEYEAHLAYQNALQYLVHT